METYLFLIVLVVSIIAMIYQEICIFIKRKHFKAIISQRSEQEVIIEKEKFLRETQIPLSTYEHVIHVICCVVSITEKNKILPSDYILGTLGGFDTYSKGMEDDLDFILEDLEMELPKGMDPQVISVGDLVMLYAQKDMAQ